MKMWLPWGKSTLDIISELEIGGGSVDSWECGLSLSLRTVTRIEPGAGTTTKSRSRSSMQIEIRQQHDVRKSQAVCSCLPGSRDRQFEAMGS